MMYHSDLIEKLKRKKCVVRVYRRLYPQYGTCGCCGLPWPVVQIHHIDVTNDLGYFAFCEHCFQHKSFEDLRNSATELWRRWAADAQLPPYSRIEFYSAFVKDWCDSRKPFRLEDVKGYGDKLKQYSVKDIDKIDTK